MTTESQQSGCTVVPLFASAEWKTKTSNLVHSRSFSCVTDEPAELGGSDLGANPAEILLWSVAGCINIGIEECARRDGIELTALKTDVAARAIPDPVAIGGMRLTVSIKADAPKEKLEAIVMESFEQSPIVGALKDKPQITVKVQ